MTFYGLPHLDSLVSLSCHSLNLTCTRLALRIQCLRHSDLWVLPPSIPRILYLPAARTSTFSEHDAFGLRTLLSIVLYKSGLCSTSSSVQISRLYLVNISTVSRLHLVVFSPSRHHITVFIHLPSRLPHSTFLSIPPKSTSDLELRNKTILVVVPSRRPLLGNHSEST